MKTTIIQRLGLGLDRAAAYALYLLLKPMKERYRTCTLSTAGLVIKAAASAVVKTGASVTHYIAKGKNGQIAAATDMPALAGTVTADLFNVYVFTVDSAGTTYSQMGTEAATEAAVKWPDLDSERAILGFIKVNPTGTGNFVGGTTALDDITVVPTVQYISPVGMFDPTARID